MDDFDESNVSPEEQAQYDQFVNNGLALLHNGESREGLVNRLQAEDDPANALAEVTVTITRRLVESARENGVELSSDVIMHGGIEILESIVDMAENSGVGEFSEEDMERATYLAMDMYRNIETEAGELNQGEFQQDVEQLKQAEASGELEGLLGQLQSRVSAAPVEPTSQNLGGLGI